MPCVQEVLSTESGCLEIRKEDKRRAREERVDKSC